MYFFPHFTTFEPSIEKSLRKLKSLRKNHPGAKSTIKCATKDLRDALLLIFGASGKPAVIEHL